MSVRRITLKADLSKKKSKLKHSFFVFRNRPSDAKIDEALYF